MKLRAAPIVLAMAVLVPAAPALAAGDGSAERAAAQRLVDGQVYVDGAAQARALVVSQPLARAIARAPIRVAVLPQSAAAAGETSAAVAERIVTAINRPDIIVIALVGRTTGAAAGPLAPVTGDRARAIVAGAQAAHQSGGFSAVNVQAALLDAIRTLRAEPPARASPSPGTSGDSGSSGPPASLVLGASFVIAVIVLLVGVLSQLPSRSRLRRRGVGASSGPAVPGPGPSGPSVLSGELTGPLPVLGGTSASAPAPAPARAPAPGPLAAIGLPGLTGTPGLPVPLRPSWTGGAWPQVVLDDETG